MSDNFTRSGNGKRVKSGARVRRVNERAGRNGWEKRLKRTMERYNRWQKSFQNVLVRREDGGDYWAMDRPQLIHKGGKP